MDLTAKLVQLLPLQKGTGKNGEWKKQDIIVETDGTYPKKVCVSIWGDKINEQILQVGNTLKISFDVESREYNGRWYTDVKAWKVESAAGGGDSSSASSYNDDRGDGGGFVSQSSNEDDLPF
ncbi:MAG: DUF3127 domain-containing protein [Pedobacter sp.]|nr:MAG: DUF3127 domain-containing protein [Pedobacter sp.]